MTNLYETLGCTQESEPADIEAAFKRLRSYYAENEDDIDPGMKIFLDDLKLAYRTLINEESRAEYDEYLL